MGEHWQSNLGSSPAFALCLLCTSLSSCIVKALGLEGLLLSTLTYWHVLWVSEVFVDPNLSYTVILIYRVRWVGWGSCYMESHWVLILVAEDQKRLGGFPGGAVVESPPADAGDTGSCPGPGRSHMPRSGWAREPWPLSLRVRSLCSATGKKKRLGINPTEYKPSVTAYFCH